MDFALTEQQELIRKEAAALARGFSLDYWLEKDRKAEYPWEFVKAFAAGGWLGMIVPEEYGGSGLGVTEASILLHEICAAGAGTSGASPIHFYMFPPLPLIKHGSADLKGRYLRRIATGEIVLSFGVTEPNAGSDTSRVETRAELHGDRYVIQGRKVWNTNAQEATHIVLLARTAPRDPAAPFRGLGRRLERDLHRRARGPGGKRRRRARQRLLSSARLAQSRAHLHRDRGSWHRPRRARSRGPVRKGADRL